MNSLCVNRKLADAVYTVYPICLNMFRVEQADTNVQGPKYLMYAKAAPLQQMQYICLHVSGTAHNVICNICLLLSK